MDIQEILKKAIIEAITSAIASEQLEVIVEIDPKIERPADENHGDYSTNVAMSLAGRLKQKPRDLAEKIVAELNTKFTDKKIIEKIEIAGPGFINFYVSAEYFFEVFEDLAGYQARLGEGIEKKRIVVEAGDPNTHKLPHIGHLYSYISGDSIARILAAMGHTIREVNYQGDVGPQVAKCIYGWILRGRPEPESLLEKVQLLQVCYQEGSKLYEEEEHKEKIQEINKQIYAGDEDIQADWLKTRQWSLDYYLEFEALLGIKQERHYLESEIWRVGLELVKENTGMGKIFEQSEGAIVYKGEQDGLHTRVFVTKAGTPTYEAKDLGLNTVKMQEWPYDLNIIPTASEQNAYFQVVIAALGKVAPELVGKIKHIGFGLVSLSTGKMSSRTGNILSGPELIETARKRVEEIIADRDGFSQEEKKEIALKVALAAVKYAFLKGSIMQNMSFDLEESLSFEGNSGPYLLYTYARIRSILDSFTGEVPAVNSGEFANLLDQPEELDLIKTLVRYNETVEAAAEKYAPHLISNYCFELAQKYNHYYKLHSINSAASGELIAARRELSDKVAQTLKSSLQLIGIEVLNRM